MRKMVHLYNAVECKPDAEDGRLRRNIVFPWDDCVAPKRRRKFRGNASYHQSNGIGVEYELDLSILTAQHFAMPISQTQDQTHDTAK